MKDAHAKLVELIAKLAMMHHKIEQGVYDGNSELLQADYAEYCEADIEFQTSMDEHMDTLS